jgi:proteasome lid subunit RPN8/RPN11
MAMGIYRWKAVFKNRAVISEKNTTIPLFEAVLNTRFEVGESNYYTKINLKEEGMEQQFFMVVDKNRSAEVPIKVIPLIPSGKELFRYKNSANLLQCNIFRIENDQDNPGEVYLSTKRMNRILNKYRQGEELTEADVKDYVQEILDWTADMTPQREKALERRRVIKEKKALRRYEYAGGEAKDCKKIVISDRAYTAMVAEALSRDPLETGGILLGQYKNDVWYVVESTDPGINTIHTKWHHETDDKYHNHLYPVVSRLYEEELVLLGLWHRHPGRLNTFSQDDNNTNTEYAKAVGNGTISFLLNFVPNAELTCYYLDHEGTGAYYKPKVLIGDKYFEGTNYLELASKETLIKKKKQLQTEMKDSAAV